MTSRRNDVGQMFRLNGEIAVVTGAASGIGRHAADLLARAGAAIVLADIDGDGAEAAVSAIAGSGSAAVAMTLDVADAAAVARAFTAIAARFGRVDVLVNSAGIGARMPTEDLPAERWSRVIAVNLTGTFLCAQAAGRVMLAQRRGRIVNIASIMGLGGNRLYPNLSYHASKGGVINLTRALAIEWADRGVRVNAIAPTFVRTGLTEKLLADRDMKAAIEQRTPMGRIAEVEDLSGALLFLCSVASGMVTGTTLTVDGGWTAG